MLLGLALIAVPLLVAILTAALQIRTLADTGQKIVLQGVAAARASQDLFSEIASLERTARLYDVLNDPNLLETYRRWDTRLTATRDQLNAYGAGETRKTLAQLGELQGTIRTTILTMPAGTGAANMAALSGRFIELSTLVDRVAQQSNAQIDAEVAALEEQTQRRNENAPLFIDSALGCTTKVVTLKHHHRRIKFRFLADLFFETKPLIERSYDSS